MRVKNTYDVVMRKVYEKQEEESGQMFTLTSEMILATAEASSINEVIEAVQKSSPTGQIISIRMLNKSNDFIDGRSSIDEDIELREDEQ